MAELPPPHVPAHAALPRAQRAARLDLHRAELRRGVTITSGGLGHRTLPYAIYNTFFIGHEYGQASAAGVVVVIGSIIIGTFALRVISTLFREEVR